ncbi:MAG: hypothetical protein EOP09_01515 [Proteobacteria bacterium]|nr:MAG: hypothetical protein EOP09_01515 [Pseudomonadota bacterium]
MKISFLALMLISTTAFAADLNKAKTYRSNGMLDEAKRELVEVAYASESSPDQKAEALLLLGDVAQEQGKPQVANENWRQVIQLYAASRFATLAKERMNARAPVAAPAVQGNQLTAGTVLVVSDPNHPWASGPLSASLASPTTLFEGSLSQAITAARQQPSIAGILEISLVTDSAFESGRVTCYRPNGGSVWVEKVMFNIGGGAERIARKFADGLAKKIARKTCP